MNTTQACPHCFPAAACLTSEVLESDVPLIYRWLGGLRLYGKNLLDSTTAASAKVKALVAARREQIFHSVLPCQLPGPKWQELVVQDRQSGGTAISS
jgi:hypothetical protein